MTTLLYLALFGLGMIGAFFSGLLGIGGAIILYPLLLYVPDVLGVGSFTAQQVSSMSMFQVLFASLSGVISFRLQRKVNSSSPAAPLELVLYMGLSTLFGSLLGAVGSNFVSEQTIHLIYGGLATLAVILMLIPVKGVEEDADIKQLSFNKPLAVMSAFSIGIVSGIIGAGGAFMLIPIMVTVLRIPTRVTISASLAIVFISAIGGVIGKWTTGQIPVLATVFTVFGSVIGAPLGSFMSRKISVAALRYGLVSVVAFTAIKIWVDFFN
ncbi:hypothetical protein BEP19_01555 [Ammoniphilus oxalaticus]|uniref:Probable membrane transporter protein n=1 Tax=Ammoniphilus oxalaticus TaxID=66863 RepID=A0A419SMZ9_9BACL|nr:sulfite exporter TauE/SafE family protein [Ammoniphilus oxalaticus]RKD25655.1 hypothetical protein BEP19_01555 [Ammoniphilus oxalaticus]